MLWTMLVIINNGFRMIYSCLFVNDAWSEAWWFPCQNGYPVIHSFCMFLPSNLGVSLSIWMLCYHANRRISHPCSLWEITVHRLQWSIWVTPPSDWPAVSLRGVGKDAVAMEAAWRSWAAHAAIKKYKQDGLSVSKNVIRINCYS